MSKSRNLSKVEVDTNGDIAAGSLGNVTVTPTAISDQANTSTGYFALPAGTTAQRPSSPANGMIRFNTELNIEWPRICAPPISASSTIHSRDGKPKI